MHMLNSLALKIRTEPVVAATRIVLNEVPPLSLWGYSCCTILTGTIELGYPEYWLDWQAPFDVTVSRFAVGKQVALLPAGVSFCIHCGETGSPTEQGHDVGSVDAMVGCNWKALVHAHPREDSRINSQVTC